MKDFIKNELICLRALEPIGSDRYNELSEALQWIEENTIKESRKEEEKTKHNFAFTTIRWKEDGKEEDVTFKLSPYNEFADKNIDEQIFFYCENEEEYKELVHDGYDNGQDFVIVGCTIFSDEL